MDERPLVKGYIDNFGMSLDIFEFLLFGWFLPFFKKIGFLAILGPPYRGIGATLRIRREMLCLPYAGFFLLSFCRDGVTIISFSSIHLVITRPALYKKKPAYMFEINNIIFRPHLDMYRGVFGLPGKNKMKANTKLTVVMCCQIFHRKSVAPSSGDFRRQRVPR